MSTYIDIIIERKRRRGEKGKVEGRVEFNEGRGRADEAMGALVEESSRIGRAVSSSDVIETPKSRVNMTIL